MMISVAGLVGRPILDTAGDRLGSIVDLVARSQDDTYPQVNGIIGDVDGRHVYIDMPTIKSIEPDRIVLCSTVMDLSAFTRSEGESVVLQDLIDHQVLDVDGVRVVRVSDVVIAQDADGYRVVGIDVSLGSFLRRVTPAFMRGSKGPQRVLDWKSIQHLGLPGEPLRLRDTNASLHEMHPSDIAALLQGLGRPERQALLSVLQPHHASAVLEEMKSHERTEVLRHAPPHKAAELLAHMEPDEAVDALRGLQALDQETLLSQMEDVHAQHLTELLAYSHKVAGGMMTTRLAVVSIDDTVHDAQRKAIESRTHGAVDGVVVVDAEGRLVDDLDALDLFAAPGKTRVRDIIGPPVPGRIRHDGSLSDVVREFVACRGTSLLVVDDDDRPLGRILADDVVDALLEMRRQS